MNILFFGTSDFAIPSIRKLAKAYNIVSLITKPAKPKGRGYKISNPPIVDVAKELGINVLQPPTLSLSLIKEIPFDIIVVVAYGGILPRDIIYFPKYGSINLHPSLLPKYRGPCPINWALINGEKKTGVTIVEINERIDEGDVIFQKEVDISEDDDYESLSLKLAEIGADCLLKTITLIEKGEFKKKKQEGRPSYAPKIKEKLIINWNDSGEKIVNLIRGVSLNPGCWTKYKDNWIKILKVKYCELSGKPGAVIGKRDGGIIVGCGVDSIIILRLQKEAKKPISGDSFLCGIKGEKEIIFS